MPQSADAANAVLEDQPEYQLSPDKWEVFCRRLDEPPKVIPALRQLFQEPELFNAEHAAKPILLNLFL